MVRETGLEHGVLHDVVVSSGVTRNVAYNSRAPVRNNRSAESMPHHRFESVLIDLPKCPSQGEEGVPSRRHPESWKPLLYL